MTNHLRTALIIVLALVIILSCTFAGRKLTDPATYDHTIEVLDKNRTTVLSLTAAAAGASAAVSAIPDDICTPLAQEISDFSSWFLVILAVLYLEKYMLTIFGAAACYLLIPVGCGALLICCFFANRLLQDIGFKLLAFAAVLLLAIPTSVWVSDQVNAIYSQSIEITIQSANAVSDNLFREIDGGDGENTTVIDGAKSLLENLSGSVADVIGQFKNVLNRFIEAIAVMIVTTCLIPLLVVMFFAWIVKTLFSIQIMLPPPLPRSGKHRSTGPDAPMLTE